MFIYIFIYICIFVVTGTSWKRDVVRHISISCPFGQNDKGCVYAYVSVCMCVCVCVCVCLMNRL